VPPARRHRDADASRKALHTALVARGHDVTRTPNAWMPRKASDAGQLLGATAQGRVNPVYHDTWPGVANAVIETYSGASDAVSEVSSW
jgi:hypothetical protein